MAGERQYESGASADEAEAPWLNHTRNPTKRFQLTGAIARFSSNLVPFNLNADRASQLKRLGLPELEC